jgi:hypothetical protein
VKKEEESRRKTKQKKERAASIGINPHDQQRIQSCKKADLSGHVNVNKDPSSCLFG